MIYSFANQKALLKIIKSHYQGVEVTPGVSDKNDSVKIGQLQRSEGTKELINSMIRKATVKYKGDVEFATHKVKTSDEYPPFDAVNLYSTVVATKQYTVGVARNGSLYATPANAFTRKDKTEVKGVATFWDSLR